MDTWNNSAKYAFGNMDQELVLQDDANAFRVSERELEFITQAYGRTVRWLVSLGVVFMGTTCLTLFSR